MFAPRPYRSVALLLAFVVGGIATPLAHQLDHLFDEGPVPVVADEALATETLAETAHDCALCEVRLHAAESTLSKHADAVGQPECAVTAPEVVPQASVRAFDGRAPPVRS